jgi:hypothetical protein
LLALDDSSVYFTSAGQYGSTPISKIDKSADLDAGAVQNLADPGGYTIYSLEVANGYVYWTDNTRVRYVSVNGGTITDLVTGRTGVGASTVDSSNAYWAEQYAVMMMPVAGGVPAPLWTSSTESPKALALDSANGMLYFTTDGGNVMKMSVAGDGGSAVVLANNQGGWNQPFPLAVDATSVYWINNDCCGPGSLVKLTPK